MDKRHIDYLLAVVADKKTSTNTLTHLDKDPKHQGDFADWLKENLDNKDPDDRKIIPSSRKKLMASPADAPNPAGGKPSQPVIKKKSEKKKPLSKDLKEFVQGPKSDKPNTKTEKPATPDSKDDGEWQIVPENADGSTGLKITAMGKRADGLVTKKVSPSNYDVEYKGRNFEIELAEGEKQWALYEIVGNIGRREYWNHFRTKDGALRAIKEELDNPTTAAPVTAAAHKNADIAHTVRDIFRASGMALGPRAAVELKPSKVSGKLVHIFSDITSVSHKDMLSIRARLTHKFHAKGFSVKSIVRKGRPCMQFSFMMREVKKDKDGNAKLVKKPVKKKSKVGNKSLAEAAFSRLEVAAKLKF